MIGERIYKYNEEVTQYIKIEDGDFEKLSLINAGDTQIFSDPDVSVMNINQTEPQALSSEQCVGTSNKNIMLTSINGVYRILCQNRLKPREWSFGRHTISASTKSYIRFNTSYYKKYITTIAVGIGGNRYIGCVTTPTQLGLDKIRRSSAVGLEFKRDSPFGVRYSTNYCSMSSSHSAQDYETNFIFPTTYIRYVN